MPRKTDFTKMHGIGNDFVMINDMAARFSETQLPVAARSMCHRRFGVGSDGLILIRPGKTERFAMRMFNPDGSESEMCGNGIRCCALFIRDQQLSTDSEIPIETGAGVLRLQILPGDRVRVDMGLARLTRGEIGVVGAADSEYLNEPIFAASRQFFGTAVSMGNPHLVIPVEDPFSIDLAEYGPMLETHPMFPARINVHFIRAEGRNEIVMRTWERGAGATLACGTGACATLVAAHRLGLTDRSALVHLPGGDLEIEWAKDGRVFMTGAAETSFTGVWG